MKKKSRLVSAMETKQNKTIVKTFNSAKTNESSLSLCVDLFGSLAAMRGRSDAEIIKAFTKAFGEDKLKALKILFWARDVRGGAGERKIFRVILKYLADTHTEIMRRNLHLIPEYGRVDDFLVLIGTRLEEDAIEILQNLLVEDLKIFIDNSPHAENEKCKFVCERIISKLQS